MIVMNSLVCRVSPHMTVFEHAGKQAWPCSPLAVKPVQQLQAHWLAGRSPLWLAARCIYDCCRHSSVWGWPLLQGLPCLGSGGTGICQGCFPDVMRLPTAGRGGQVVSAWQVGWWGKFTGEHQDRASWCQHNRWRVLETVPASKFFLQRTF